MNNIRHLILCCLAGVLSGPVGLFGETPKVVEVRKIWDGAPHSAFTDLARFQDKWYCTFREGTGHIPGEDGMIRVLVSDDGEQWQSQALIAEEGIDLRDPKLSVTADDRLMIVCGGSVYVEVPGEKQKRLTDRRPRTMFMGKDGTWSKPTKVCEEGQWLWRVTWHKGKAYGVSYDSSKRGTADDRTLTLHVSDDGVQFQPLAFLDVPGFANETTVRFLADDTMIAFVRRENGSQNAWFGASKPPYKDWKWHECEHRVGGPNMIVLPDGQIFAGGRSYPGGAKTVLAKLVLPDGASPPEYRYEPLITFPSGGDNSYPGFVYHEDMLWMSYYSSHEGKTSIYLAKVKLKE